MIRSLDDAWRGYEVVDPRVRMIKFENQPTIEKAEDENSQSIAVKILIGIPLG